MQKIELSGFDQWQKNICQALLHGDDEIAGIDDMTEFDLNIEDAFREACQWMKPACDCGAAKVKTTHAEWCSVQEDDL